MIWLARKVITRRGAIGTSTPGLRVAADALALVAQDEGAEAGDLDVLALRQARGTCGAARARRRSPIRRATGRVGDGRRRRGPRASACLRRPPHCSPARCRDRPSYSPALNGVPPAVSNYTFVTEFGSCRQFDNCLIFQTFQYLSAAAPQVNPPPIASSTTRSPRLIRPSLDRRVERERNRRRRGIGVPVDGDHHLFGRKAQFLRGGVEDSRVGLVRHDPVDVRRASGPPRRALR